MTTTISVFTIIIPMPNAPSGIWKLPAYRTPTSALSPTIRTAGIPRTRRSTVTTMASMIEPKVPAREPASVQAWAVLPGCWPV